MAEPFLGEIRMVGFNFAPRGWAFCDGQLLPINQNPTLYSVLRARYGGDGRVSFGLPDLRGRTPIHRNQGYHIGQKSGEETHSLSVEEMPAHTHPLRGTNAMGKSGSPAGGVLAQSAGNVYSSTPVGRLEVSLNGASMPSAGGGGGHNNVQPSLAVNFCIALRGMMTRP